MYLDCGFRVFVRFISQLLSPQGPIELTSSDMLLSVCGRYTLLHCQVMNDFDCMICLVFLKGLLNALNVENVCPLCFKKLTIVNLVVSSMNVMKYFAPNMGG